jgi:methylmalonyl-CoA/ethylmalonyl-CoA epimerase
MILHHIGIVVNDIEKYEDSMIYEEKLLQVIDPIQQSKLALYKNFGSCYIELIQPINENSYTMNFLKKNGNGFHHLCFEVVSKEAMHEIVEKKKLIFINGPFPAILFDNRNVYFYFSRNKEIVEFLIEN